MSPGSRHCPPKVAALRSLALLILAMLASPAALADGVIIKSVSSEHPVGSIVADGEVLHLAAGQTVTVLDRSGALIERSTGAYAGPSRREALGLIETAKALAAGPRAKSAIGGTRTGEDDKSGCKVSAPSTTADSCIPHGLVAKRLRVTGYTPASAKAPALLVLESNFDGYAICVGWNPSEDARFVAGADPLHPIALTASSPVRLGAPAAGASNPALSSVACAGVSAATWKSLQSPALKALTANSAAVVLSSFSRMHGDTTAEARTAPPSKPQP